MKRIMVAYCNENKTFSATLTLIHTLTSTWHVSIKNWKLKKKKKIRSKQQLKRVELCFHFIQCLNQLKWLGNSYHFIHMNRMQWIFIYKFVFVPSNENRIYLLVYWECEYRLYAIKNLLDKLWYHCVLCAGMCESSRWHRLFCG